MNPLPKRIEDKIDRDGPGGCWLWMGCINSQGYGKWTGPKNKTYRAHRIVYELLVGTIPSGRELDHLCRTRSCVNPDHLEPVLHKINIQRGVTGQSPHSGDWQRQKTHCPAGHLYDAENTYVHPRTGERKCRECRKLNMRKYSNRKKDNERGRSQLVS